MTLAELIRQFRREARDRVAPFFWGDEDVTDLFNDAVEEAAIRGRLLHESGSSAVCRINVLADRSACRLHPALYELTYIAFQGPSCPPSKLQLQSVEWLDDHVRDWRTQVDTPCYAVQSDTGLRLVPTPRDAGILMVEGYRVPINRMAGDTDEPEIHQAHHRHLVQWVLHRCFGEPDSEAFDPNRSAIAEAAFTQYFGLRPDVNLRRITREDSPQHVQAIWP